MVDLNKKLTVEDLTAIHNEALMLLEQTRLDKMALAVMNHSSVERFYFSPRGGLMSYTLRAASKTRVGVLPPRSTMDRIRALCAANARLAAAYDRHYEEYGETIW